MRVSKFAIKLFSHKKGRLLQPMFQETAPSTKLHKSPILASLCNASEKSLGKTVAKAWSPIHLSLQKLVPLPFETFLTTLLENQFTPTPPSNVINYFHHPDAYRGHLVPTSGEKAEMLSPYFSLNTTFQRGNSSWRRRHFHLAIRLILPNFTSRTPKPPYF